VWHPSRLARGTGKKGEARSLMERLTYLRRHGVMVRAVDRGDMIANPLLWGIEDEQQSAYSENLGTWVKAGVERRKAAGKPVGAIPFGYAIEPELSADGKVIVDRKGKVVNRRVADPKTGPLRVVLLERIADGASPGSVARWLNAQGITTPRGKAFTEKTVTQIVESHVHAGGNSYPALVTTEQAQAALDGLRRKDPVAIQRRKGGKRPNESYLLRGIAFCACGEPHYASDKWLGRSRAYICRHKVKPTGLCDRPPIPAELLETHVLNHLAWFVDSVEGWLGELVRERDGQRKVREGQLDRETASLAALDHTRDERMAELEEVGITKVGMELIERMDARREAQQQRVVDAEAVLAEWAPPPNLNAALEFYSELLDLVQGRVKKAQGARELNEALASVLVGLWCWIEDGRLRVEFELRKPPEMILPNDPVLPQERPDGDWLPPVELPSKPGPNPYSS
jgi:hypothetical protein